MKHALIPNEQSVQVEVSPLLGLPPMMLLAIILVALHGICGSGLGHRLEKDGTPRNVDIVLSQKGSELQL